MGGRRREKKTPRVKNMKLSLARAHAHTCWGMPSPLHFPPRLLPSTVIATTSLPPGAGCPGVPAGCCRAIQHKGFSERLFPAWWFSLLEGCAALYRVSHPRGILHITALAGPLLIPDILTALTEQRSSLPHPAYKAGEKNKIITIQPP